MPNRLETYRVEAYNTAKQSENKMHDDTVARRFGFSGGLVPGVDVLAYMMHMPIVRWRRDFLERGLIDADLGGGLIKKRLAREGEGKRGGYRALIAYQRGKRIIFLYGFPKSGMDNISDADLLALRKLTKVYSALSEDEFRDAIGSRVLLEVDTDGEKLQK